MWEPAGSVHDATTHPVDTVYLAEVYGPVAFHGKDGRPPRMVDWRATQRMLDRASGKGPSQSGYDPIDAALVHTQAATWQPGRPGREALVLRVSPDTGHAHLVVRAKAGTEEPARIHLGACEIFVLDGSLEVDGSVLHAGDHLVEPAGTRRGVAKAVTDTTYLVSLYGPIAYTDDDGRIAGLFDWQTAAALAG